MWNTESHHFSSVHCSVHSVFFFPQVPACTLQTSGTSGSTTATVIQWASKTQRRWTCVLLFGLWWPTWSLTWRKCSLDSESLINDWTNPCPSASSSGWLHRYHENSPSAWCCCFFLWFDFILTSDTLLITPLSCSMYSSFDTCVILFFIFLLSYYNVKEL